MSIKYNFDDWRFREAIAHQSIKAAGNDADPLSFEFKTDIWGILCGLNIAGKIGEN